MEWHEAVSVHSGEAFALMQAELSARLHSPAWRHAPKQDAAKALSAAAWAWRVTMTLTAFAAGLGRVAGRAAPRARRDVSSGEAAAFRALTAAVRMRRSRATAAEAEEQVQRARTALRQARSDARVTARRALEEKLRRLSATNPQAAAGVLRRLIAGPRLGLPLAINDPENPGRQLVGPDEVLEGAAKYILRRDNPPWAEQWDEQHHAALTDAVSRIRAEAQQDLRRWAPAEEFTSSRQGCAASEWTPGAVGSHTQQSSAATSQ